MPGLIFWTLSWVNLLLTRANLTDADLRGATLTANLLDADLTGANLRQVRELRCTTLGTAKNWAHAFRDETLACGAEIPHPTNE